MAREAAAATGRGRSRRDAWQRRATAWLRQQIELAESTQAGLAAAVETFEGNKFSACRHVGDDSRLGYRLMTAGGSRLLARAGSESDPQTDILTCGSICIAVHDSTIRRGNGLKYWG